MTTSVRELYLDSYARQARLAPGLLALLPISITVALLGLRRFAPVSVTLGVLASAGGPALLADLVREQGLAVQQRLYQTWGCMPTTRRLRLRGTDNSPVQTEKWRSAIEALTGAKLPSKRQEELNPQNADQAIESAVDDARDLLRDRASYRLLDRELRTYGFRRNMRGARRVALILAVVGAVCSGILAVVASKSELEPAIISAVIDALAIIFWSSTVRDDWVGSSAERYAYQLFQAAVVATR